MGQHCLSIKKDETVPQRLASAHCARALRAKPAPPQPDRRTRHHHLIHAADCPLTGFLTLKLRLPASIRKACRSAVLPVTATPDRAAEEPRIPALCISSYVPAPGTAGSAAAEFQETGRVHICSELMSPHSRLNPGRKPCKCCHRVYLCCHKHLIYLSHMNIASISHIGAAKVF